MADLLLLGLKASTHRGPSPGAEGQVGVAVEVPESNTVSQVLAGKRHFWHSKGSIPQRFQTTDSPNRAVLTPPNFRYPLLFFV